MLGAQMLAGAEYAVYSTGLRYAPRLLRNAEALAHRLRNRWLRVRRHEGVLDGESLTVRTLLWDERFAHYLERWLPEAVVDEPPQRTLTRAHHTADVTILEVPAFRAEPSPSCFVVPKSVTHVDALDRADPPLVIRTAAAARRAHLRFDLTRDRRALDAFIQEIYRPFVGERHGKLARPTESSVLHLVLLRGALLRVLDGGRVVGGALVARSLVDRQRLEIVVIGARGEDETLRTAPVVFAREHARSEGYRACDHLGSPPFLRDGVFQRKRRYGTILEPTAHSSDRLMIHVADTPAARAFVRHNPFVVMPGLCDVREILPC